MSLLERMVADPKRSKYISEEYSGKSGVLIYQAHFKMAPIHTPLATRGIKTCAGLVVIDHVRNFHYLAHVDAMVSVESIKKSLECFGDFEDQDIYCMPGIDSFGTMQNILTAMLDKPNTLERIRFLRGDHKIFNDASHVAIYNGKIYYAPVNVGEWDGTDTESFSYRKLI